jgi:hypothetical protein
MVPPLIEDRDRVVFPLCEMGQPPCIPHGEDLNSYLLEFVIWKDASETQQPRQEVHELQNRIAAVLRHRRMSCIAESSNINVNGPFVAGRLERLGRLSRKDPFRRVREGVDKRSHPVTVLLFADIVHQANVAFCNHTCVPQLQECGYLTGYGAFGVIGSSAEDVGVVVTWWEIRWNHISVRVQD